MLLSIPYSPPYHRHMVDTSATKGPLLRPEVRCTSIEKLSPLWPDYRCMEHGSSLLEAMVCVALLALHIAIATPGLLRWSESRKLFRVTEELRLALERSYITANRFQERVDVWFERDGSVLGLRGSNQVFALPPAAGISRAIKEAGQTSVSFYSSRSATPATILVSSKTRSCALILSLRGRVRRAC